MAEETLGVLGEEAVRLFHEMAAEFIRNRRPRGGRVPQVTRPFSPQQQRCLLVLTPPAGIPAMWEEVSGGGTGSGTQGDLTDSGGTGTSIGDAGDRPGFADCSVYSLEDMTTRGRVLTHPRLIPTGETITVYNARFTAINGSQFITALRDDFGIWWVPQNGDLFEDCV